MTIDLGDQPDAVQRMVAANDVYCDELFERLEARLDEKDLCALSTAVGKAAGNAFRLGVGHMMLLLVEHGVALDREPVDYRPFDLWAERYEG